LRRNPYQLVSKNTVRIENILKDGLDYQLKKYPRTLKSFDFGARILDFGLNPTDKFGGWKLSCQPPSKIGNLKSLIG
jgi:hypothetical protein